MKPQGERYTVAVDFDGVVHSYTTPWIAAETIPDPPVEGAIEWLNEIGEWFEVVIHTTRAKTREGMVAVGEWLTKHGFVGQVVITDCKVPALIYLDDRAWRFMGPGSFPTREQIHRALPWNKRPFVMEGDQFTAEKVVELPFDPATAHTATTREDAIELARAWADGRRSWCNLGGSDEAIAVRDAQEVVKWTAMAAVLPPARRAAPEVSLVRGDPRFGNHLRCTADGCVWRWELSREFTSDETRTGFEMFSTHVLCDHHEVLS